MTTEQPSDTTNFVLDVFAEVLRQLPDQSVELDPERMLVNVAPGRPLYPSRPHVLVTVYPNRRYMEENYTISGYLVRHGHIWREAALNMSDLDNRCSRVHAIRQADGSLSLELGDEPWIFYHDMAKWS